MSGPGINRLARVLDGRMRNHVDKPVIAELAVVQADMSLQCDHFGPPIPQGGWYMSETYHGKLRPGDKVLVNWIEHETIPVVVDKVVSS